MQVYGTQPRSSLRLSTGLACWVLIAGLGVSQGAGAAPRFWQQVRDPAARRAAELVRRADRARTPAAELGDSSALLAKLNERSALLLSLAGGEALADPGLSYLLGDCWARSGGVHAAEAERVLTTALALAPEHVLAPGAWRSLAEVLGQRGNDVLARAAFERALERETDQELRAETYLALGRSWLRSREPERALEPLAFATSEARVQATWAFAEWSLAVALDLVRDFPEASRHVLSASRARFGLSGEVSIVDVAEVEAELGAEKAYYLALQFEAEARAAGSSRNKDARILDAADGAHSETRLLLAAQLMWLGYRRQVADDHPWAARADEHINAIRERLDTEDDAALDREVLRAPDFD